MRTVLDLVPFDPIQGSWELYLLSLELILHLFRKVHEFEMGKIVYPETQQKYTHQCPDKGSCIWAPLYTQL